MPRDAVTIHGEDEVSWFRSSDKARRGFCRTCGSSLFWDPLQADFLAIAMGAFEKPTGTHIKVHIHAADRGDYYDIEDGLPRREH